MDDKTDPTGAFWISTGAPSLPWGERVMAVIHASVLNEPVRPGPQLQAKL